MPPKRLSRAESQARTRERLLDAAARLFAKRGFAGTSVDQITAAAGYTKGAFYANFDSKEAAFLALLDRHSRESHRTAQQMPHASTGELRAGILEHACEHARHGDWLILGLEFKLAAARSPKLRARYAAVRGALVANAAKEIESLFRRSGRTLPADPALLCTAIEFLMEGQALLGRIDQEAMGHEKAAAIFELFINRVLFGE